VAANPPDHCHSQGDNLRYSINDFSSAAEVADSVMEQNQLMEVVMVDFVDIINQIAEFKAPSTAMTLPKLRTCKDVQYVVAQAAQQLRVLLAEFDGDSVSELAKEVEDLEDDIEELRDELAICSKEKT